MELVDLMEMLSNNIEHILGKYKGEIMQEETWSSISREIYNLLQIYKQEAKIFDYELRINKSLSDLLISFTAPRVEIAFLYVHYIKNFNALKCNVDIYPLK